MSARTILRIGLFAVLAGAIAWGAVYRDAIDMAAIEAYLKDLGSIAAFIHVAIFAVATVLFFPGSILALTGGALFGPVLGTIANLTGATLGATAAFLIARYIASDWVARNSAEAGAGRFKRIIDGVDNEGWRFVAFVRLVPLFPFNLLNYALGLTRISLAHYVMATLVCMLPGGIAFTYLGFAGREAIAGGEAAIQSGMIALALLAAAVFLPRLVRAVRGGNKLDVHKLKAWLDRGEDILIVDVRGADEFDGPEGHVPGARNIALDQLAARIGELDQCRQRPVAIVCRTDKRSAKAAELLRGEGFTEVSVVKGGITEWNRKGFASGPAAAPESAGTPQRES